jgi:pimeloyl-ACP methyl ester carboxylesterase
VSELVVVDPLAEVARPWLYGRLAHVPLAGSLVFKQVLGRGLFGAYFRELFLANPEAISNQRLDAYYQSFNTPAARGSVLATLRATVDPRPVAAQTSRIRTPTLVLWGHRDRLLPARFTARVSSYSTPGTRRKKSVRASSPTRSGASCAKRAALSEVATIWAAFEKRS